MNPLDYIIYKPLPNYFNEIEEYNRNNGWNSTELTPDDYDINVVKPYHCGLKHIKEITIPKIDKIKDKIDGFFIIEGDVKIDINYQQFLDLNIDKPTWIGYKKKLKDYIVGNFLIYIPIQFFQEFKELLEKQKQLIYSDRFFTKLYFSNWLHLHPKSLAKEVPHFSNVINKIRY